MEMKDHKDRKRSSGMKKEALVEKNQRKRPHLLGLSRVSESVGTWEPGSEAQRFLARHKFLHMVKNALL